MFYRLFLYFRWFCHFDDDQYVNVPGLLRKLADFPADQSWYLGKNSIDRPLEILDRDKQEQVPIPPPLPWYLGKNSIDRPLEILDRDKQEQVPIPPPPPPPSLLPFTSILSP
jgi:hypothetical protein